jgi:hypothetical protein
LRLVIARFTLLCAFLPYFEAMSPPSCWMASKG